MSLLTRIGKRFREKPKSTTLKLPSLPTPREILDDIDSCQSNDSVIALATLIQNKGCTSLLDIDLSEGASSAKDSHLSFLTPYQIKEKVSDDSVSHSNHPIKRKGSGGPNLNVSGTFKAKKPSDIEQINSYNKLKQFLLLFEKSEELLENLEPHFKRVEKTLKECNDEMTKDNDSEHESDVCSSPLM